MKHLRISRIVVFLLLCLAGAGEARAQAEVRFLDVGEGDAILVRSLGRTALIDAGPSPVIAGELRRLGVRSLDLLILTHPHSDHIGGALAVMRALPTKYFMDDGMPYTTVTYRRVMSFVETHGLTYLKPTARTIAVGDVRLRILPPPSPRTLDDANANNRSVGVVLQEGTFRAMLPGDAQQDEIGAWLRADEVPRGVVVLKAAHHGSRNGLTPLWLATLKPKLVVISVGAGNPYGHPHPWALRYYGAGGRTVLRTDQGGDVVFRVRHDGGYTILRGGGGGGERHVHD